MGEAGREFCELVEAVWRRFLVQNGQSLENGRELWECAERLRQLVDERGLPRPLGPGELGAPGGMPEAECGPLVERVLGATKNPLLAEAIRQLVKACFYPEFRICRDSFCEVDTAGACRRQEVGRARKRVSGTHCVDCPHWVALAPAEHAMFLRQHWRGAATELETHREVFLPEDFRALRRWLHARARISV